MRSKEPVPESQVSWYDYWLAQGRTWHTWSERAQEEQRVMSTARDKRDDMHTAERMATAIVRFTVSQCVVDYQFSLLLVQSLESVNDQQQAYLSIETAFTLTLPDGIVACDPEHDPRGLGPALTLFQRTVESVQLADDASLSMTFSGDIQLLVPSHPAYESWNLHTPARDLLIALPDRATGRARKLPSGTDRVTRGVSWSGNEPGGPAGRRDSQLATPPVHAPAGCTQVLRSLLPLG
jgi:Family of unknown function (DUF6188)